MKFNRIIKIGAAICGLFLFATSLSGYLLIRFEEKKQAQEIQDRGAYLVSLIALYPLKDFSSDRRDFFLRTLMEYSLSQGLLYVIVHDQAGAPVISLAPAETSSGIPPEIRTNSLQASGVLTQSFQPAGMPYRVYEFAKPIFKDGSRAGTVRLGLKMASVMVFTKERASVLAMIACFIFCALFLTYHWMNSALRSLKELISRRAVADHGDAAVKPSERSSSEREQVIPILKDLERSLGDMDSRLYAMKEDNLKLISKLGVTSFEKNQIIDILDSINFGIVVTDLQDRVTLVNEYMLKLMGSNRDTVINKTVDQLFPQKEVVHFISQNASGDTVSGRNSIETSFPEQAPGEVFQVSLSRLVSGERTTIGRMIFVRNVTTINLAKKAQQDFVAHVSHELRTPLTNIKAYTEMLMDGEVENPEMQKEFYNTITQETNRLSGIIQNMLNISKMEMGSIALNKGLVRTEWLIDDCSTTVEVSAQSKNISFEKHLPDVLPTFIGDKELLKTAIINILGNAVKYTPENGRIRFSVEELGGSVIFDVADSGYGMFPEDLSHIFDKFYRSNNPSITAQAGSGLGLAIAHEIVLLHDGEIEVQSKLGEGSRFTIRIPKEEYTVGSS